MWRTEGTLSDPRAGLEATGSRNPDFRDAQLSYGPGHRVHPVELWSWVQRDVQLSYGPGRRVFFSFQTYRTQFFRFLIPSFQFSDFQYTVFRNSFSEFDFQFSEMPQLSYGPGHQIF